MSESGKRRLLVTSALPYANGELHLGHILEAVMTDIYVRYHRMVGDDILFVCASDSHGSPIELKARELGVTPEELATRYREHHHRDLKAFDISLDEFHTTHSDETRRHLYAIYQAAQDAGLIYRKSVEGLYSPEDQRFLPDRWVRGTCPFCKSPDQYGDSCENCTRTYTPSDLIDPHSTISGGPVEVRSSDHVFYKLSATQPFLEEWVRHPGRMPDATRKFVLEWLSGGLRDWDISRDAPYFGFPIPGDEEKFFYVWVDAPVGYIGTTDYHCNRVGRRFEEFWTDPSSEVVHVIGKDIVYFHCLFWPSMLKTVGYNTPSRVQVHGFLTVNSEKMSKSRGTFINAETYLRHLDPEYLRYFLARKLRPDPSDLDLHVGEWTDPEDPQSLDASSSELIERVNAEFVNNLANFSSRVVQFLNKRLDSRLGSLPPEAGEAAKRVEDFRRRVGKAYDSFDSAGALRLISDLAIEANKYFQDAEPWKVVKEDIEAARTICTMGANYVKALGGLLKPVVPVYASKIEKALAIAPMSWEDIRFDLENREIGQFETLVTRIDPKSVRNMVLESLQSEPAPPAPEVAALKDEITIDEFLKVDLRVARVEKAESVKGADKLLQLTIDLGQGPSRTIFAGIKKYYDPASLVGRCIIVVANLKPRKMRFGLSQGMLLAATDDDDVLLLDVDGDPSPGSTVG